MGLCMGAINEVKMVKIAIFMSKVTIGTVQSPKMLMIWTDSSGHEPNGLMHVRKNSMRGHGVTHGGHQMGQNGLWCVSHENCPHLWLDREAFIQKWVETGPISWIDWHLTDWHTETWPIDTWWTDWNLADWHLTNWLTLDGLTDWDVTEWLPDIWQINQLTFDWFTDWHLTDWLTDTWLIDCLTLDWLTHWHFID